MTLSQELALQRIQNRYNGIEIEDAIEDLDASAADGRMALLKYMEMAVNADRRYNELWSRVTAALDALHDIADEISRL